MENFIYLAGTTPWGERCAQLNDDNYRHNARLESLTYISQLIRTFGESPPGTFFKPVWCNHDFGQYLDIQLHYDDEEQQHVIYISNVESGVEKWDERALRELQKAGYTLPAEKVIPITRSVHYATKLKGA